MAEATVHAPDINDMVKATLPNLARLSFTQIAQELQTYVMMSEWLKKDKVTVESGKNIERQLMYRTIGAARHTGLWDKDNVRAGKHLENLTVDWKHADTSYPVNRRELLMNRGKSRIQKLMSPRRTGALLDLAVELEDAAWDAPVSTDDLKAWGVLYWIVKNATTGFNGGAPSGFTTVGSVDLSVVTNFKNFTGEYVSISRNDLVRLMSNGFMSTGFKAPVETSDMKKFHKRWKLFTNKEVMLDLSILAESRNDKLGFILNPADGSVLFNKLQFQWIPKLDADTTNPIYLIDMDSFETIVLSGDVLYEQVRPASNQHNVTNVFVDLTYQFLCLDRRRNAVFSTA